MRNGDVLLQAALNGDRDHPAAPLTPEELAAEARAAVGAGVVSLHPYDERCRVPRSLGDEERRFGETVQRANAFLEAGADCVFVPGVADAETLSALAREVVGPLNVLAGPGPPTPELVGLGVRRVSVVSGPARAPGKRNLHLDRRGRYPLSGSQ